jgi:peroxiredoxin
MALTESNPFEIGTTAPDFSLLNTVDNGTVSLLNAKGNKGTVIVFICNHCPFVIHVNEQLVKVANDYLSKGIAFIAISSNDVEKYPQDGPEKMHDVAKKLNYPFPYLYDETQEVAKAYDAACTPDFYVFDENLKAVYHGQFCASRPNNGIPVTGEDLCKVLDNVLSNQPPLTKQKPSIGCSIKWK